MSSGGKKLGRARGQAPKASRGLSLRKQGWARVAHLCRQLTEGRHEKPVVFEDHNIRSLCFGIDGAAQSEMRLNDPQALISAYTRKMMGFLLFLDRPQEIVMIGLGGGSLAKFCYHHLPSTRVTVIEIDAQVIALRSHFHIPADDARLSVIHGEGAAYVAALADSNHNAEVLLVDAFNRQSIAKEVTERGFLHNAHRMLSRLGIFVMNLVADRKLCNRWIEDIRSVFGDPVIAVSIDSGDNVVVFAGRSLQDQRCLRGAAHNARHIETRFGLLFPTLLAQSREFLTGEAIQRFP
jgi:spermidine synthase